ncbi:MAG TPA: nucleotidyltransferase family protein [Gaiellaceae bacterium]|nr:nucleotidyltransferase family protein [Gaiellaceae bacterium]
MTEARAHAGVRPPTLEELRARRDEIVEIAAESGASNIAVFGSVARGEADEASDVDFLVDLDASRSLFDLGRLLADLRDLLGCEVDVVTRSGLRERIRDRVLGEARPL